MTDGQDIEYSEVIENGTYTLVAVDGHVMLDKLHEPFPDTGNRQITDAFKRIVELETENEQLTLQNKSQRDVVHDAHRRINDANRELADVTRRFNDANRVLAETTVERDVIREDRDELREQLAADEQQARSWRPKLLKEALQRNNLDIDLGKSITDQACDWLDTLAGERQQLTVDRDRWRARAEREPTTTVWTQHDHDHLVAALTKHGTNPNLCFGTLVELVASTLQRLDNQGKQAAARATATALDLDRAIRLANSKDAKIDELRANEQVRAKVTEQTLARLKELRTERNDALADRDAASEQRDNALNALVELQTKLRHWADGDAADLHERAADERKRALTAFSDASNVHQTPDDPWGIDD